MVGEDLSAFFDTVAGFASPATLAGSSVAVIVDTDSLVELDGVVTQQPIALLRASSAPNAAPGQQLLVGSSTFRVRQVLREPPDGALLRLVLTRSA